MHKKGKLVYIKGNLTVHQPEVFLTIPTLLSQPGKVGYCTLSYFTVKMKQLSPFIAELGDFFRSLFPILFP